MNLISYNALWVLIGTFVLGLASGMIGCFAYWKRQSLMSDALSHAALPGVVAGFAVLGYKHLPTMILGAVLSALLGALLIQWIRISSRIKEDTAMGIVLSVFFGLGIMLLTFANRMPGGNQSGLDSFIFGQAASMVGPDVTVMSTLAILVLLVACIAFKEWKLFLFDPQFAQGLGLSGRLMNTVYLSVLVSVIVVGIQAVGVVLMAALLIIPSVSARYWTDSFAGMVLLSGLFGAVSGLAGTLLSLLGSGWPTGPFIVIAATVLFAVSLTFGLRKGLVAAWIVRRSQRAEALQSPGLAHSAEGGRP